MNRRDRVTRYRHVFKTISWRIVGTTDTILLGWLISGDPTIGLGVGGAEFFTKTILYYIHERVWYKLDLGITKTKNNERT